MFFGSTGSSRFDAPSGEYGVLYVAVDVYGAFIETFGRRLGRQSLQLADFATRALARVTTSRPLRLVDLAGVGLAQVGADARLTTGDYHLAH
jgi:hypothetical protein